ncbi:MAG: MBL fold metallo-hydrolase [Thermodesulfobacteriota bacterium]|nr:MBL fold metallo-hydrolase [Thermodesulfobacteriota bacterium]
MIEEVFPNIFREEIPLPQNPLKAINSYVIKGDGRFLMIDTGMNRPECLQAMEAYIKELGVDLKKTDFFITHLHADHLGLVSELAQDSSKVYFNYPDTEIINDPNHWEEMAASAGMNGFPESDIEAAILKHPGRRYHARRPLPLTLLREGDRIAAGKYVFQCVETPGHTRGHMCLYEPKEKIFFSGDHILESITPNISLWTADDDPLQDYLQSLDKINEYDIGRVLPGHRRPFDHHRRRIAELKKHHEARNEEVLSILKEGRQSAYQVASNMSWDIDCERWEDFPLPQQWFAGGEALAHLQYLQGLGLVKRELQNGKALFLLRE